MVLAKLEVIKELLEKRNYVCKILTQSENIPIDQLAVILKKDDLNRDKILIIRLVPQNLSTQDGLLGITAKERQYQEIHLISALPFLINEQYLAETARFILLLNKGTELPGFELSEVDRQIVFRHSFIVPEDDLDERILLSLVGMVEVLLSIFSDSLESVSSGKQSLKDILASYKREK